MLAKFKLLLVFATCIGCLLGCSNYSNKVSEGYPPIQLGDDRNDAFSKCEKAGEVQYTISGLSGKNEDYLFYAGSSKTGNIDRIAVFTLKKELVSAEGFEPVARECLTNLELPMPLSDIEAQIGTIHFDNGSGIYLPSYVTREASIISLQCSDDMVYGIIESDIYP